MATKSDGSELLQYVSTNKDVLSSTYSFSTEEEHSQNEPDCLVTGVDKRVLSQDRGSQAVAPQNTPNNPHNGYLSSSVSQQQHENDIANNLPGGSFEDVNCSDDRSKQKDSCDLSSGSNTKHGGQKEKKSGEHLMSNSGPPHGPVHVPDELHLDPFKTISDMTSKYMAWIKPLLVALFLVQVILVTIDIYKGIGQQSSHSKCVSDTSNSIPIISLRILSRVILPGCILAYFWWWVPDNPACVVRKKFIVEILNPRNNDTASEFIKRFVNPFSKNKAGTSHHLQEIQMDLDERIFRVVLSSCLVSVVLSTALTTFSVFEFLTPVDFFSILGVADILSFGCLLIMCGTMCSLLFLDEEIKRYFRQFRTCCTNQQLKKKAKAVEESISERWYPMNTLICMLTVLYCFFLTISWSSGIPLSCGVSIDTEVLMNDSPSEYWLTFLIVLTAGQFLGTSPYSYHSFAIVCIVVETLILVMLYFLSPSLEWSQFTHILYAIVPLNYLLWYHIMSIPRQWEGIKMTPVSPWDSRSAYWSKFCIRAAAAAFIVLTVFLSWRTEYNHIIPSAIGRFSTGTSDEHNIRLFKHFMHLVHETKPTPSSPD